MRRLTLLVGASMVLLAACGQTGELFLPGAEVEKVTPTPTTTTPAPTDDDEEPKKEPTE